jgi:hypothetical protein
MTFVGRVHNPKIMLGILVTRADWSLPLDGYNWRDIAPWIFRRRLSLMSGSSEDDLLLVAPALLRQALSYLVGGASDGAFDERFFTTQRMRRWTRTIRARKATSSTTKWRRLCAIWVGMQRLEGVCLLSSIGGSLRISVTSMSLAWRNDDNRILILECKDFSPAKTYGEMAKMLSEYREVIGQNGELDALGRHLSRIQTLQRLAWCRSLCR